MPLKVLGFIKDGGGFLISQGCRGIEGEALSAVPTDISRMEGVPAQSSPQPECRPNASSPPQGSAGDALGVEALALEVV